MANESNGKHCVIVIVEDDKDLLDMLVFSFESEGFQVNGFTTGTDFLKDFGETNANPISLVILDRLLPDMDGLDILRQIESKIDKKIPVLFLSVLSSEKDMLSGLKHGAVDYIAKPFSLPVLMSKALALIRRNEHQ